MAIFLNNLSAMEMALLICGGFVVTTWASIVACRPYAQRWIHCQRNANDMIGFALASYATLYGILLGLLAVEAYQDFSAVQGAISKSAATVATLYLDLDGMPNPLRGRLQAELRDYTSEMLETHWSHMGAPSSAAGVSPRLRTLLD